MLKKFLIILFLSFASLQASELEQSEISLQGSLTFADIIGEAEGQLGVTVKLPKKADDVARMDYNQVINLRQLAQAVVLHFAQDNIPLSWKYDSRVLSFKRKDVVSDPKVTGSKSSKPSGSSTGTNRYPVPTIKNPPAKLNYPSMPRWAQEKTVSNRVNEITTSIDNLPNLTRSGVSNPTWSAAGSHPSFSGSGTERSTRSSSMSSLGEISGDRGSFSVKIPSSPPSIIRPEPTLDTFEQPSVSGLSDLPSIGNPILSTGSAASNPSTSKSRPSWPSMTQPSAVGKSPSYRSPQTAPTQARRGNFGITPYPEGAVAFINDAPSIVPGAAKEGFVEWATRLRGAMREGNRMVLEAEQEELERRLRWLKEHLR